MSSSGSLLKNWSDDCLPPEAVFPSREALHKAINKWALLRNYAFVVGKSRKNLLNSNCTITYTYNKGYKLLNLLNKRKQKIITREIKYFFLFY